MAQKIYCKTGKSLIGLRTVLESVAFLYSVIEGSKTNRFIASLSCMSTDRKTVMLLGIKKDGEL